MPNRRSFLAEGGKGLASARLAGTALASGMFLPEAAASRGSAKSVLLPTHEHREDLEERLDFPAAWKINVPNMAGHHAPVLTRDEIRKCIRREGDASGVVHPYSYMQHPELDLDEPRGA